MAISDVLAAVYGMSNLTKLFNYGGAECVMAAWVSWIFERLDMKLLIFRLGPEEQGEGRGGTIR